MKKILLLILFFTAVFLFISCSGAPAPAPVINNGQSGSITVMATNYPFYVLIDGQNKGVISLGKNGNFAVPNGKHYIVVTRKNIFSEGIEINVNNYSHIFSASLEKQGTPPKWVAILSQGFRASGSPSGTGSNSVKKSTIETAVNNVFEDLSPSLTAKSKMAVVNISSSNSSEGEFVCEELTLLFVRANKYSIVDRRSLDAIKKEQNFHMTGEVDDNSVVSIGQLLGAEVVITGAITGEGSTKRLRVKALDVKTGQIRAMSSQSI